MAKNKEAKCKICRREGVKLFLKGERCNSDKCSFDRKPYSPGLHGREKKRVTEYKIQLREKQKTKAMYGMLERQFSIFYKRADLKKGATGENLLRMLECRLDNVVSRTAELRQDSLSTTDIFLSTEKAQTFRLSS